MYGEYCQLYQTGDNVNIAAFRDVQIVAIGWRNLYNNYADLCIPAVKIPAPINAVPPQRLNHLRTLVFLIAWRS